MTRPKCFISPILEADFRGEMAGNSKRDLPPKTTEKQCVVVLKIGSSIYFGLFLFLAEKSEIMSRVSSNGQKRKMF